MGLFVEEFTPDQTWTTRGRTVGEGDIMLFAGLSGDYNPVHVDAAFCATTEFGDTVHAHITCLSARTSRKPDRGVVTLRIEVLNHRQESIQTGTLTLLMKTKTS